MRTVNDTTKIPLNAGARRFLGKFNRENLTAAEFYSFKQICAIIILMLSLLPPSVSPAAHPPTPNIVGEVKQSVVSIQTDQKIRSRYHPDSYFVSHFFSEFFEMGKKKQDSFYHFRCTGSGVIIDHNGTILTNAHVIQGAHEILVGIPGQKPSSARVLGVDAAEDLALLKMDKFENTKPISFGDSDTAKEGDGIFAIGYDSATISVVKRGIISAQKRTVRTGSRQAYRQMIQTDALVNPGNSGGPLINEKGEMVGLVTQKEYFREGTAFAIPVNRIKELMPSLESRDDEKRKIYEFQTKFGFLVSEQISEDGFPELLIQEVNKERSAFRSGIREGDILVQFHNAYPKSNDDLLFASERTYSKRIRLQIKRQDRAFFTYLEVPS